MDVEIIDVNGRSMRHSASSYNGNAEHNGEGVLNTGDDAAAQEEDVISEPCLGMEFDSEDAAKTFYDEYARSIGFSTKLGHISHSKTDETVTSREFICSRKGLRKWHSDSCDAMLKIEIKSKDKWVVTNFVKDHSHTLVPPSKLHYLRPRKHFSGSTNADGTVPNGVMFVSMDGDQSRVKHPGSVSYMGRQPGSKKTLRKDAQNLLDYFKKMQGENPGFFYAIQLDDENCMVNVFWADARSRTAYSHFGDAITLDTTCCYRSSHYKVPFAPFTGVNHHGQTVLFGCAILLDDSEASFIWLFKSFLAAMKDHSPVSLTTGKEKAIQTAVAKALPQIRHCISKSQVLREGQERLAHVCQFNPNFQVELYNCINLTDTVEEFESSWNAILDKYDLRRIDWLQNLYNNRTEWVPVYFRNTFFAALSPHQAYDGSFFNGYVNEHTTLPLFFRQYERALENWFEKEIEADFDTISTSPVLRTPSPMEKQAANLYTKKIFSKFQEELVETFVYTANRIDGDANVSTFRVAKYEDDNKVYTVALNIPEMTASCSCQMFEYSGVLCRHVLTVFTVTNVLTLPSHYILKRWTRNARSGVGSDERSGDLSGQESLTLRYNHLCCEAMKYAEEGAVSIETFNVAMGALREGAKKISATKKNVAKAAPSNPQTSAIGYDDKRKCTSDTTPFLWPRQDEGTRQFNLNDGPIPVPPVADLNLPRMAPVSLHRGDVLSETMVILPCLKSMTWVMEKKNSAPANRVAIISLKLQDQSKTPLGESEIKFQLSGITLEPMLSSMAAISEQLSSPAKRVAVINLKLHDSDTNSGESDVKFQVSRDTLAAMLRSMAYIRVQLSNPAEPQADPLSKKRRK